MMLMTASAVVTVSIPAPSVVVAVATTDVDVSLTVAVALLAATDKVIVSEPSVAASATKLTAMMALPRESTVTVPVRVPPTTSDDDTPVMM